MPAIVGDAAIAAIDALLAKEISGSWFFKKEMTDYMEDAMISDLQTRLTHLYKRAVLLNNDRAFNPRYRFNRLIGADTQQPRVILQLLLPGNHFNNPKVVGEIEIDIELSVYGSLSLSLPPEPPGTALVRENNWSVSEAELAALNKLMVAAQEWQALKSKHFPVEVSCQEDGIKIQAHYGNPMDQVRKALARA